MSGMLPIILYSAMLTYTWILLTVFVQLLAVFFFGERYNPLENYMLNVKQSLKEQKTMRFTISWAYQIQFQTIFPICQYWLIIQLKLFVRYKHIFQSNKTITVKEQGSVSLSLSC